MKQQNGVKRWIKNVTAIVLAGFILISLGISSVGIAQAQVQGEEDAVSWEYLLDFNDQDPESAAQQASSLAPDLTSNDVSSKLLTLDASNYRLSMTGRKGIEQLRQVLYSPEMANFLGGAGELEINMPVDQLEALTLTLESNLTTGYQWKFVSSDGVRFTQMGEPTFVSRSRGYGTTSLQTLILQPESAGNASIKLEYRRSFGPQETATRRLRVGFAAQATAIDLSDPVPTIIDVTASLGETGENPIAEISDNKSLPTSWDWRTQGIVPDVRDQGSCGSCWSFGTVSVMESAVKKGGGPLEDLSEQFLISCNNDSWSCNGGLTATKYHYNTLGKSQTVVGAVLESAKPYTATDGTCTVAYSHPYKASGWQFVTGSEWTMPTVDQIKNAIYTYGPVTAGVCADSGWDSYSGGVYNPSSNECGGSTNHQIVLVGWDDSDSTWILRNSWGPYWGDNGYMHIRWDTTGTTSRVGEGTSWVQYTGTSPTVPTPKSPAGTITDRTPTYKWTEVSGATNYQYQLRKGTKTVYTKTVGAGTCNGTTCSSTPATTLGYAAYKWRVRAKVNGVWTAYSAFKSFTIKNPLIPTIRIPKGTITDRTPTYRWTKVNRATQYQFQLRKGTKLVYTKTVGTGACNTKTCSNTPKTTLAYAGYKWRVRAKVGGVWKPYSKYKTFKVTTPKPKAGFWESTTGDEFWVTPDQKNVDDFAIYITVSGCGNYKITHTVPVSIANKKFSFTGSFYANGTFDTTSRAHGTDGLKSFYLPGCGTVNGGPWSWTATWKHASQPLAILEDEAEAIFKIVSQPPYYHIIDSVIAR